MLKYVQLDGPSEDAFKQLSDHPLTARVSFDGEKFWVDGKNVQQGLTDNLKKRFYSNYKAPTGWAPYEFTSNKELGEKVHKQLHCIYTCSTRGFCTCLKRTNPKKLHPLAKTAKLFLEKNDLTPMATEFSIYSPSIGMCTALDMVAYGHRYTLHQRSVIISWKTGYHADYDQDKSGQFLDQPLDKYASSPQHHNKLQSIMEYKILEKDYGIKFDCYITVYLGHKGKFTYTPEHLKEQSLYKCKGNEIYSLMCK